MEPSQILRTRAVCTLTGLSRVTIWRLVRDGKFPRPVQLTGRRATGYYRSDVEGWLAARPQA